MSRSKTMVLLGAGASVEAGIPASVDLTETLISRFRLHSRSGEVLRFVYGGLMLGKGTRGEDPLQGINVEDLIEAISQLANRKKLQIAPFIALWNQGVTSFQEADAREALMNAFREIADVSNARAQGGERMSKMLSLDHTLDSLSDPGAHDFLFTKQSVIRELIYLLWIEDASKVSYFEPLLAQGKTQPFTIASLNYDNTIEMACDSLGIPCSTGLKAWNNLEGFTQPEKGVELLKLHGSVTWEKSNNWYRRSTEVPMPRIQIKEKPRDAVHRGYEPAVIFGSGNKLTAEGPFLELLLAFRERLDKCKEMIVIGYSFSDEHINDAIWRWLNRNPAHTLHVIDYAEDKEIVPFKNMFNYLDDRYSFSLDGAGAGIKEVFG